MIIDNNLYYKYIYDKKLYVFSNKKMSVLNEYKPYSSQLIIQTKNQLDFVLSDCTNPTIELNSGLTTRGMITYFDFRRKKTANERYKYNSCSTSEVVLNDITLTGYDNGFLNNDFTGNSITIENDCTLKLHEVNGNTGIFSYDCEYIIKGIEDENYYSFNGGFLQGFYKLEGFDYNVLPNVIDNAIEMEFVIRPRSDYRSCGQIINNLFSGNTNGIFFYIGTRAENKFSLYYNGELSGLTIETTNEERPLYTNEINEVLTDNKYLFFNRTTNGFTTNTWQEGDSVLLTDTKPQKTINYYTIFNRTENGVTTNTYDSKSISINNEYNNIKDLTDNAFALKYNEDGSISYRYLIKSCDNENGYEIIEEKTASDIINVNKWNIVHVRYQILNGNITECDEHSLGRKMRIFIYVNGYLKLVSKELPEFDFRALNDSYDKQESVPYNISLGGGTQGLIDALTPDKTMPFSFVSTLEKNFCGTFIGDMRSFKIYNEPLECHEIKNNYLFEMTQNSIINKINIKNSLVYYGFGFLEEDIIEGGNTMPANKSMYTSFNCTSKNDKERFFYIVTKDYIGAIAQEFTVGGAPMVTNMEEKQIFKKDCIVYSSAEEYPKNTTMKIISSNF